MARGPWYDPKAHKTRVSQEHEQKSQEHKQSKTNEQRLHSGQKLFVETYHTNHNIISFDAVNSAEDQQQMPGGCPPVHKTIYLFFFIDIWHKLFFFVNVWNCFGLQETEAAFADAYSNLHSKLGASPSSSR